MSRVERIQKQAVKAGVRASKRRDHLITSDELMDLKIQMMPSPLRVVLFLCGCLLLGFAVTAWPTGSHGYQVLEGLLGAVMLLAGIFGIRRTFSGIIDGVANCGAEAIVEAVLGGIGSVLD